MHPKIRKRWKGYRECSNKIMLPCMHKHLNTCIPTRVSWDSAETQAVTNRVNSNILWRRRRLKRR